LFGLWLSEMFENRVFMKPSFFVIVALFFRLSPLKKTEPSYLLELKLSIRVSTIFISDALKSNSSLSSYYIDDVG